MSVKHQLSPDESHSVDESIASKRQNTKGIAHLKSQFITESSTQESSNNNDDDDDEENMDTERLQDGKVKNGRRNKKQRGQNKSRDNRQMKETKKLCPNYIGNPKGEICKFNEKCKFEHDLDTYLAKRTPEIKLSDTKWGVDICPVWKTLGYCPMGFKCKFLSTHWNPDTKELIVDDTFQVAEGTPLYEINKELNHITFDEKHQLIKKLFPFEKSNHILKIIDAFQQENRDMKAAENKKINDPVATEKAPQVEQREKELQQHREAQRELYNQYKDTRYFASEKRVLNFANRKILSPLTTVGNLPFRRLMKKLNCDITYSEMALGVPLIQGTNSEWALPKCHISEQGGFGVQIAASKAWQASKAAEALSTFTPALNEINLNSGCPIDLLYKQGSGSALLDNPARLIRCLNGMNYVSGEIPVTVKIRTGTKENHPVADSIVKRLVFETDVAAITLHGRSRQQRYTKLANWDYIKDISEQLRSFEIEYKENAENRDRHRIQFVGNGDINNFEDWYHYQRELPAMDSIMVARGALLKPWIFEEIDAQQYLDKSANERLDILRDYTQYAMEHWGTDEYGIQQCRRFFCEFMSFFHRYIPMGICERYPVLLNERPPKWVGRNELETQMGSSDVSDWIKLSELFLGPTPDNFHFVPKHKSNSIA